MRILHTSDWHLGQKLGQQDLSADLERQLALIASYLDEYRVDVMLVTGDIFSDLCYRQSDRMQAAIIAIGEAFGPYLARGGTIIAISGNHDSLRVLDTFRGVLQLALPRHAHHASSIDGRSGTFHLFTGPHNLRLSDATGYVVQFQAMPFPTPAKYLRDEHTQFSSPEDRNRTLQQQFLKTLELRRTKEVRPEWPAVLLSHIPVLGVAVENGYALKEADSVLIEQRSIDNGWAYAAFGHIHRHQAIHGRPNMRYAGSLMRLDAGEANDDKSCVLLEIGASANGTPGLLGEPRELPLPCPPIATITITTLDEVDTLMARYPHAAETLAKIIVHWEPVWEVDRDALLRRICAIFPRWYERATPLTMRHQGSVGQMVDYQITDVPTTVRDYARTHFSQSPDRAAALALLEELLTEEV